MFLFLIFLFCFFFEAFYLIDKVMQSTWHLGVNRFDIRIVSLGLPNFDRLQNSITVKYHLMGLTQFRRFFWTSSMNRDTCMAPVVGCKS